MVPVPVPYYGAVGQRGSGTVGQWDVESMRSLAGWFVSCLHSTGGEWRVEREERGERRGLL